ncbi:FtsX-like permease family protein [Roseivirga sp.]|uniref:FtsX-like permease family protein n=1 Tax=Roseivirga sp. TaxID=1964215 RepID=UPI002B26FAB0|nr:FtsX-like permease family protein [Roseivirga sp.]
MQQPPKLPLKILRFFCAEHRLEEIEGDLFEEFQDQVQSYGYRKARRLYYWTVIRSFRSYLFDYQSNPTHPLSFITMIRHYFKTAFRGMYKHKSFTAINLFGLSIGLASSLMLFLVVIEQLRKDYDLPDKDQIFRVESNSGLRPSEGYKDRTPAAVGPFLKQSFPQVEECTVLNKIKWDVTIINGDESDYVTEDFLIADSTFFNIFPQTFIIGSAKTALNDPKNIVLTESAAFKYFGSDSPIGQEIRTINNRRTRFIVSAIIKDPPPHASIQFNIMIAQDIQFDITSPGYDMTHVYLKLAKNASIAEFEKRANREISTVVTGNLMKSIQYRLRSFEEVKYDLEIPSDLIEPTDKRLYIIFTTIALAILLLAIINYINLSTIRALKRGHEAGIRKIIGAGKGSFMIQFLTESWLISFAALPIAILMVESFMPYFERALNTSLSFNYLTNPTFILIVFGIVFIVGLIAGLYPALLVSRFKFTEFIKGNLTSSNKGQTIRRVLVIFQFAISIVLVVGAVVIQRQLKMFQNQKLTYNPEQVIVLDKGFSSNFDLIRTDLENLPSVLTSSITSSPPAGDSYRFNTDNMKLGELVYGHDIDHHYVELLNLEFVRGENFDPEKTSNFSPSVLINETMAKLLETVNPKQSPNPLEEKYAFLYEQAKIQGVVKDFHLQSLHEKIKPMVLFYESFNGRNGAYTLIKINTTNIEGTLESIEKIWDTHIPDNPFRYQFLDTLFDHLYTTEMRLGKIFQLFTAIALIVSCLGLFGLVSFIVQSKVREIAIRKVFGAKVVQIVSLFLKEICWLIVIASLIGLPIAYWTMNLWLEDFAYHTNIPTSLIITTFLAMILVACITVFTNTFKTAKQNPVDALRSE